MQGVERGDEPRFAATLQLKGRPEMWVAGIDRFRCIRVLLCRATRNAYFPALAEAQPENKRQPKEATRGELQ